ncbi:MAG: hypothetical protein Q9M19_00940 [Mariprofundaceae bacterium]|nr:hypothetical protein [Mariprofundaceae bacterium]
MSLTGCGGGDSASTASANNNAAAATTVALTGVVVTGTNSGGVAVGALKAASTIHGVLPNAIIIAVDKFGNTITSSADQTGTFTLTLEENVGYGIIFLDSRTLAVIGSLVQASNQTKAGSVSLSGDGDLGNIVINPATGKAVSENEVNGTLKSAVVAQAPAGLDSNGDGKIDQNEISAAQTASLTNGTSLKHLTTADFFSNPNTWWSASNTWSDPSFGSGTQMSLGVANIQAKTTGPNQGLVDAIKSSDVTYYQSYTDTNNATTTGYFLVNTVGNYADYTSNTFVAPPATFDFFTGPWTWAALDYADTTTDYIWSKDLGDPNATWSKNVPLNIVFGKTYSESFTESDGTQSQTFVVKLAQENGNNYIFTDVSGVKHIVIIVDVIWSWTPSATCIGCTADQGTEAFYIISGFGGADFTARDSAGSLITPSTAIATQTFGYINKDAAGNFVSASNENPLLAALPKLIDTERDQMLAYVWDNRDVVGIMPAISSVGAGNFQAYMYPVYDTYGQAVSPSSWDPATYLSNTLTAGANQLFALAVNYATPNAVDSYSMVVEWRTSDSTGSTVAIAGLTPFTAVAAANNKVESILNLNVTLTTPTIAQIGTSNSYTYFDPALGNNVSEGWAQLWVVMKDANGNIAEERALDYYTIR